MTKPTRVFRTELAKALGIPSSTVKYYSELGIFPFEYHDPENRLSSRFYDIEECQERWEKVQEMKAKGMNMGEILTGLYRDGTLNLKEGRADKKALLDILLRNGG